jgi:hypothetical protein
MHEDFFVQSNVVLLNLYHTGPLMQTLPVLLKSFMLEPILSGASVTKKKKFYNVGIRTG